MTHLRKAAKAALFLAMATIGAGLASAQPQCFTFKLQGTYAAHLTGSAVGMGPIAMIAVVTFDGAGKFTISEIASFNGMIVRAPNAGTYKVNADCTGTTANPFPDGSTGHLDFVIADDGKTLYGIETDPGAILSGVLTRM